MSSNVVVIQMIPIRVTIMCSAAMSDLTVNALSDAMVVSIAKTVASRREAPLNMR